MSTSARSLKWIGGRVAPTSMAPVWAKANINTLYNIRREYDSEIRNGLYTESNITWTLTARRQGSDERVVLGVFPRLKDAKLAANADCGLA